MALGNIEGYFPPILCRPCSGWPRTSLSFSLLFSPSLPRACTRSHAEYARLDRRASATLSPFHPRWPAKGLEPARRGCFTAVGGATKLEEKLPRVGEGQGAEAPSPASDAVPSGRSTERYRLRKSRIDAAIGETTPKHNTTNRHPRLGIFRSCLYHRLHVSRERSTIFARIIPSLSIWRAKYIEDARALAGCIANSEPRQIPIESRTSRMSKGSRRPKGLEPLNHSPGILSCHSSTPLKSYWCDGTLSSSCGHRQTQSHSFQCSLDSKVDGTLTKVLAVSLCFVIDLQRWRSGTNKNDRVHGIFTGIGGQRTRSKKKRRKKLRKFRELSSFESRASSSWKIRVTPRPSTGDRNEGSAKVSLNSCQRGYHGVSGR